MDLHQVNFSMGSLDVVANSYYNFATLLGCSGCYYFTNLLLSICN